ncbi:hypothetical protein [Pyramidobacter sp. C12-8]|uniref:hypothetical protein n=1 Tax=Pyramidobacter sp. C12-8 TaxID=1943580 RepID=UPI00197E1181|nr:hypothetical protein [Pyramidobacter sp. C12-8]
MNDLLKINGRRIVLRQRVNSEQKTLLCFYEYFDTQSEKLQGPREAQKAAAEN